MFDFSTKKETARTVLNLLLSFLGSVFLLLTVLCLVISLTLSRQNIISCLERTDYFNAAAADLAVELNHLAIPSGLDEDFFNDKINLSELSRLTLEAVESNYEGSAVTLNTDAIKNELINHFNEFAKSDTVINLNSNNTEALEELADMCVEKYVSFAAPSLLRYLALYSARLFNYSLMGVAALALLSAFTLIFNSILNKENKEKRTLFAFFSLSSAGIMCILPAAILLIGGFIGRVNLKPLSALNYLVGFVNGALVLLLIFGVILLALGAMVLCIKKINK